MTTTTGIADEPIPLYELYMAGATAMCDAWVIDRHPIHGMNRAGEQQIAMVSITAPQSTIKGMRANMQIPKDGAQASLLAYAPEDPRTPSHQGLGMGLLNEGSYTQGRVGRLRGYHHAIAMAENAPTAWKADDPNTHNAPEEIFYVFARKESDGPGIFYREFIKRSPTPTIPEWTEPIWAMCVKRGEIKELEGFRINGWRCEMRYGEIERALQQAVAKGELPIPG